MNPRVLHDELSECLSSEDLYQYIAGELDEDYEIGIEEHLAECEWCRLLLEDIADFTIEQVQHHTQYLAIARGARMETILHRFLGAGERFLAAASQLAKDTISREVVAGATLLFGSRGEFGLAAVGDLPYQLAPASAGAMRGERGDEGRQVVPARQLVSSGNEVSISVDPRELVISVSLGAEVSRNGRTAVVIIDESGREVIIPSGQLNSTSQRYTYEASPFSAQGKYLVLVA